MAMTTHELAALLESISAGFGTALRAQVVADLTSAAAALKETQDAPLAGFLKDRNSRPSGAKSQAKAKVDASGAVHDAVRVYGDLRANRTGGIEEIRSRLQAFASLPAAVVQEVAVQVGITPARSRSETVKRLIENLEVLRMGQIKGDGILVP